VIELTVLGAFSVKNGLGRVSGSRVTGGGGCTGGGVLGGGGGDWQLLAEQIVVFKIKTAIQLNRNKTGEAQEGE